MRRISALLISFILLAFLSACAAEKDNEPVAEQSQSMERRSETGVETQGIPDEKGETMIYAHIGEHVLEIKLEDDPSSEAFLSLLAEGDISVDMHDYGSFEKVGLLGSTLPTDDEKITTGPGDVILYQGNQITIYYDTNTWDFTRIGKVQNLSQGELEDVLGDGDVTAVFSLRRGQAENTMVGVFDLGSSG